MKFEGKEVKNAPTATASNTAIENNNCAAKTNASEIRIHEFNVVGVLKEKKPAQTSSLDDSRTICAPRESTARLTNGSFSASAR